MTTTPDLSTRLREFLRTEASPFPGATNLLHEDADALDARYDRQAGGSIIARHSHRSVAGSSTLAYRLRHGPCAFQDMSVETGLASARLQVTLNPVLPSETEWAEASGGVDVAVADAVAGGTLLCTLVATAFSMQSVHLGDLLTQCGLHLKPGDVIAVSMWSIGRSTVLMTWGELP